MSHAPKVLEIRSVQIFYGEIFNILDIQYLTKHLTILLKLIVILQKICNINISCSSPHFAKKHLFGCNFYFYKEQKISQMSNVKNAGYFP